MVKFGALSTSSAESGYITLVPTTVCTFTGLRNLYLRPDARTENHPHEVSNPVHPNHSTTAIISGIAVLLDLFSHKPSAHIRSQTIDNLLMLIVYQFFCPPKVPGDL